jgi:cellulase/cellobiase CelA1
MVRHSCCADPCDLLSQYNSANNEHNYVQMLYERVTALVPDFNPRFIIDTGRNGVDGPIRKSCSHWCNIRHAGLGRMPTSATELPHVIDAYFWLKVRARIHTHG